jgi:hypothetical protein
VKSEDLNLHRTRFPRSIHKRKNILHSRLPPPSAPLPRPLTRHRALHRHPLLSLTHPSRPMPSSAPGCPHPPYLPPLHPGLDGRVLIGCLQIQSWLRGASSPSPLYLFLGLGNGCGMVGLVAEVLGGSWLGSRLRGEEEQLRGSCGWLELGPGAADFCIGFLHVGNL